MPVIAITASGAQKDRAYVSKLGVARYSKKPSDFDQFLELGEMVREVVEESSHQW